MLDHDLPEKAPLILVVDDVAKNLEVIGNILSLEDYQISVAGDGQKAWNILQRISPDLILLDIMMPTLDGYTLCRRIKALEDKKDIPIIFITAKSNPEDLVKGFEVGAVDYITKPFNAAELSVRVKTHISLYRTKKRNQLLIDELRQALCQVKKLTGLLPICSGCKKIRDDDGYWNKVEAYISAHADVRFSHGICPDCVRKQYPDLADKILSGYEPGQ
ncbi:MAG: response regulator [Proteobacteria bacterium]|nr:response regulator [Pseudomonadota bacterium]